MKMTMRDHWLDFWHALPPFRGRLAIARIVAQHVLSLGLPPVAWAKLPNGFRMKVDLRWQGGYDVLYYFRMYETPLSNLIRRSVAVDGGILIDVGANIGAFCFLAADVLRKHGGRAIAIEPLRQNTEFLKESLAQNRLEDVIQIEEVAVGDEEGVLVLEVMAPGEIANARPTTWSDDAPPSGGTTVTMRTLDSVTDGVRGVEFVKIDVEGAELFVLKGAVALLTRERPLVYCEFHREFMASNGTTEQAIAEFAVSVNYDIRYLDRTGTVSSSPPQPNSRFLDIILVPLTLTPHQRALVESPRGPDAR